MEMLRGDLITAAGLTDWRKLAQGIHARFRIDDFGQGVAFLAAVATAGARLTHYPKVRMAPEFVDLELVSDDAIYRDAEGVEHIVEWVTQRDLDLARQISALAAEQGLEPDPASVSEVELGLDCATPATIAPVWAALLTGALNSQGRGTPSAEIRDATGRVPNLWFGDDPLRVPGQKFHVEVYVAAEAAGQRIAAAVAAGGRIVDDASPGLTVIADQEGNRGVVCST